MSTLGTDCRFGRLEVSWCGSHLICPINVFDAEACRLGNEEPRDNGNDHRQPGIHKASLRAQIARIDIIHVRGDKIEQPTANGANNEGNRLRVLAKTVGRDLRADGPGYTNSGIDTVRDEDVPVGRKTTFR